MMLIIAATAVVSILALQVTSSRMNEHGQALADDRSSRRAAYERHNKTGSRIVEQDLDKYVDAERRRFEDARDRSHRAARRAQVAVAVTSAIGLGLALLVRRRLTAPAGKVPGIAKSAEEDVRDGVVELVSYGLRTPLSTLSRGISSLRDAGLRDEDLRERIEHMSSATERIEELIDSAALGSGRIGLHCERCETRSIIVTSLDMFFARAKQRDIRLKTDARGIIPIYADRLRTIQILANLLGNALRFTPPGGMVTVSAWPDDGGVRFAVTDTGPGIPAEQRPYLFDRSWRRDLAGERDRRLGLYVCKRLVEAHRGRIGVDSGLGRGTVCWFVIPSEDKQRHFNDCV